jgi:GDP-4-dehydro-6-deoxy-D-mannose reductase
MRVLILGATGFAGRVLAEDLLRDGHDVTGSSRSAAAETLKLGPTQGISAASIPLVRCDVTSPTDVATVLEQVRPEATVLLAGLASPPAAQADPIGAYAVHALGTVALLTEVARLAPKMRVLVVTSSEVYGVVDPAALPLTEESPLRPASIYAASKAAADLAAGAFVASRGLDVVRVRPFNHTGPGQRRGFVCPDFAVQVAAIVAGRRPASIEVGNLDAKRDFSDVRDIARGYRLALLRGKGGEVYNLCSGRAVAIREVLETLCALGGIAPQIHSDAARRRAIDVPAYWGSAEKAARELGWRPEIPWRQTLGELLERAIADEAQGPHGVE